MLFEELLRVGCDERRPAREHPEQDHAEGVDVARRRRLVAGRLLGRDVGGRPEHGAGLGEGASAAESRDPEIRDLGVHLLVEEDVRGLEVAMDESMGVRMREPGGDIVRDAFRFLVAQRLAGREPVLERATAQVLEDHVRPPLHVAVLEELDDIRMRE